MDILQAQKRLNLVVESVNKVIVGKKREINLLLVALLSEGHVLLEDVPGTGKTVMAKAFAASLGCRFSRVQFTPDVLPTDVTGLHIYNQKSEEFEYRQGPVMTNVLLADEINRATPRTQSSLLEAMAERQVTVDGRTFKLENPFLVIATQNPVESQGTFPLPEAQLDRFLLKLNVGYPTLDEETEMIRRFRTGQPLDHIEAIISKEEIKQVQEQVKSVSIHEDIEKYLLRIVHHTRNHDQIEIGVSPRGTLAMMRAAQAMAMIDGRNYCIPDDIKSIAKEVLAHRIILTMEAALQVTPEELIEEICRTTLVPVESGA